MFFPRVASYFEKFQQPCVLDYLNSVKRVAEAHVLSTQGGLSKTTIFNKSKKASNAEWPLAEHCDVCDILVIRFTDISEENKGGMKIALTPTTARRWLKERGFAFLCYEPMIK